MSSPEALRPSAGWIWRMAWRDSRSQRRRLLLYAASVVAGMAALVSLHALRATVEMGVEGQAKSLLGSDLHITTRQPISPALWEKLQARAGRASRETDFASMLAFAGDRGARLVEVRGIEGDFPFYGTVETVPAGAWPRLQREGGILLEPALLEQFGARPGDRVKLGQAEFNILGTVTKAPARGNRFGGFSPEVYVRLADLPATGLLGTRSLASHHVHLEAPAAQTVRQIKKDFADENWKFETPESRREALEKALADLQEFLGVVALVALLLGAVGIAGAIYAHVSRRVATVAILRCLGCSSGSAFGVYLVQALALGAAGTVVGAAVGVGLHAGSVLLLRGSLGLAMSPWPDWAVVARTSGAGFLVCSAFALLPLWRLWKISPAAALRGGEESSGASAGWLVYGLLGGLLAGLSVIGAARPGRMLIMDAGLALAFLLLAGTAKLLMRGARRALRPTWPYLLRQGVSNLYRPQNQTLLFLLSLGLGVFLLLTVLLTRNLLQEKISLNRLDQSPSVYLIDVQPDQIAGVGEVLSSMGLPVLESAPMVTMRIQAIRGVPVAELEKIGSVPKWTLQREYRSTYRPALNATERIVAGQWIAATPDPNAPAPISLEKDLAKDLHLQVGDELTLDVQGLPIAVRVSSLREVDWSKFTLNFFMVFPTGVLEEAPGFHVLTTRLPPGSTSGALQRALVQKFPNVTAIDLTQILETVRAIVGKLTRAVTLMSLFTVLAGLPILLGALWNGREQRLKESVLLRTLGASARQVRTILLIEYATLGVLSGLTAALLAVAANAALACFVFEGAPHPSPGLLAAAFVATTALAVGGGWALSRGVTTRPPLEILREGG